MKGTHFFLPPNVPHNPCRYENTIGIVVEQDRPAGVNDKVRWYCQNVRQSFMKLNFI